MPKLGDLAKLIRSKNAGAFELTIDIMFGDEDTYQRVKGSKVVSIFLISKMYNTFKDCVKITYFDPAYSIKITIPRSTACGSRYDTDVFGGQQYGPLVELDIP